MPNIVNPSLTFYHSEAEIIVISLDSGFYSVGIVEHKDSSVAKFPFDFDRTDKESCVDTADRICKGFYGTLEETLKRFPYYSMDYPIRRK